MELPEQRHPFLFYQMLQMFPNIPHDIIQIYTRQYANDAELCARMLSLQSSKYTAAEEDVDLHTALISQQLTDLKLDSYVVVPKQIENNNGTMNCSSSLPNMHFSSTSDNNNTNNEEISLHLLPSLLPDIKYDNHCTRNFNSKSFASDNYEISNVPYEAVIDGFKDNSNGKQNEGYRDCSSSLKEHFPNELFINIEADDENLHSWRPNMTLNSLSSDLFLTQPTFSNYSDLNLYPFVNSNINRVGECSLENNKIFHMEDSKSSKPSYVQNCSSACDVYRNVNLEEENRIKNIQSHLNIQKAQLNILRYEIMKTKLDLQRYREEVARMAQDLKKKLLSQDAQDIEKISKENEELRLECQCLCMEVDFYQKGEARLGDVNENISGKSRIAPVSEMC